MQRGELAAGIAGRVGLWTKQSEARAVIEAALAAEKAAQLAAAEAAAAAAYVEFGSFFKLIKRLNKFFRFFGCRKPPPKSGKKK